MTTTAPSSPVRVLCVDDHRLVLDGLVLLIGAQPDIEVVAMATSGEEAVASFRRCRPDVTLMDLQLTGISGIDAIRAIRHDDPAARVIVLTMYEGDEDIYRALQAGAATYLLKDILADELITMIRDVHAGRHPIPPGVQARLSARTARGRLTPREVEVVQLIAEGLRNKEIAARLNIATETVQVHVKNILAKLNATDRSATIAEALRRGIIHIR